jgi:PAS domain S-box-containing protein
MFTHEAAMTEPAPMQTKPRGASAGLARFFPVGAGRLPLSMFFLLTLWMFLVISGLLYWLQHTGQDASDETRRTYQVLFTYQRVETALVEREAGLRGYLLAQSGGFRATYLAGQREFDLSLRNLRDLTAGSKDHQGRIDRIQELADEWATHHALPAMELVRRNGAAGTTQARQALADRKSLMDALRREVREGIDLEVTLLREREAAEEVDSRRIVISTVALFVLGLSMAIVVLILLLRLEYNSRILEREVEERRRAEARAGQIIEHSPHATVIAGRTGAILQVNAETLRAFGYRREELLGQPVEMLVPERYRAAHPQYREGYMSAPTVRPMGTGRDLYASRKDGTEFPVDISLSPVESGPDLMVIASIVDITEQRQSESELRRAMHSFETVNRELETFAYSVAHDLRAPLRSMSGFAQLLLDEHSSGLPAVSSNRLERIRDAGTRMSELIDDLLTLSRITRSELRRETVDLSAIAHGVLDELRNSQPARNVECTVGANLTVTGDPQLLRILLVNLLSNAWKFTGNKAQARIVFDADESADGPAFFVRDNGAGFDMAYADKLFGPFQRLHHVNEFPGTGVGLATALRIVTRHGGRIWAEAAEGRGATFYFAL